MDKAAGLAKTRDSSKLTSKRTSPKPLGGMGSVKLALNVGVFDRDTRVKPTSAVEFVMNNRIASYLPEVIWAEATICGKN
jgi:hypothetical protein